MKRFFEGWYFKHQARGKTLAVIPGRTGDGAFVQIVTDHLSRNIPYPLTAYHKTRGELRVGGNIFSQTGAALDIRDGTFALTGSLKYGQFAPLKSDIMGPLRFLPMECRHGVVSMRHTVSGALSLCGERIDLSGGVGYIETDSGRSFPEGYTWVQCNDFPMGGSVFASIAKIPFLGLHFWGCIAVVWLSGREYRLATYSGARILRNEPGIIELSQGGYRLEITTEPGEGHPLAAPEGGVMRRTIHESVSCHAHFRFSRGEAVLFDAHSGHASYEYVPISTATSGG